MNFKRINFISFLTVLIGVSGIIGPIIWDYYRSNSELQVKTLDHSVVIEKPIKLDGLVISYRGENLDELSKSTFTITNTGRVPIVKDEFVKPLIIEFSNKLNVIEVKIDEMNPNNIDAKLIFDKTEGKVTFDIPLLNPGDQIIFSALAKTSEIKFTATARIVGICSLIVKNEPPEIVPDKNRPWTVYPVGFFTILIFLSTFTGISKIPEDRRIKKLIKNNKFKIPDINLKEEFISWINTTFSFSTLKERKALIRFVNELPEESKFSISHHKVIMSTLHTIFDNSVPQIFIVLMAELLVCLGAWYVISNI